MRWGEARWAIRESDGEVSSGCSRMPETSFSEIETGFKAPSDPNRPSRGLDRSILRLYI